MLLQPNNCCRGHGQGLGAERRVHCIFHASLTHHNRGLVLAATNETIHPHRVPRGMPAGILPNQKRPRKQSSSLSCTGRVIWGDLLRGERKKIEGWNQRVGLTGTSHYVLAKTDSFSPFPIQKCHCLTLIIVHQNNKKTRNDQLGYINSKKP